jgi:transposase
VTERRAYPSDISDARWALIAATLLAWQQSRIDRRPTGEPARTDVREVLNAIFSVNRTGIQGRLGRSPRGRWAGRRDITILQCGVN